MMQPPPPLPISSTSSWSSSLSSPSTILSNNDNGSSSHNSITLLWETTRWRRKLLLHGIMILLVLRGMMKQKSSTTDSSMLFLRNLDFTTPISPTTILSPDTSPQNVSIKSSSSSSNITTTTTTSVVGKVGMISSELRFQDDDDNSPTTTTNSSRSRSSGGTTTTNSSSADNNYLNNNNNNKVATSATGTTQTTSDTTNPNSYSTSCERILSQITYNTNNPKSNNNRPRTTRLEFIHIPKTGGSMIERMAAEHNVSWGLCHYWWNISRKYPCPPVPLATTPHPKPSERKYATHPKLHIPNWHVPLKYFEDGIPFWAQQGGGGNRNGNDVEEDVQFFTVVRNPYTRVVSEWNYNQGVPFRKRKLWNDATYMNRVLQTRLKGVHTHRPPVGELYPKDYPKHKDYFQTDGHYIPQVDFIDFNTTTTSTTTKNTNPIIILKLETLQEDFECLKQAFPQFFLVVGETNTNTTTTTTTYDWTLPGKYPTKPGALTVANLTQETRDIIVQTYQQDFIQFGYDM